MKVNSNEIDVSKEDQVKINHFSRLNMQFHEKQRTLAAKKEQLEALKDGLDEMELLDDDEKIPYKFGDCYFTIKVTQARELTEKNILTLKKETQETATSIDELKKQMGNLKAKLYAKFGNNINLEEE